MAIASAERLLSDGRYAEAVRVADAALDADPTNTFARQFRAWAHMASGAFALALADYGECLKERPADPTVLIDRAWTHVQRQDMPMAVRDLTTAISSQGEDDAPAFAYWLRAVALRRQGNLQGALDDLDRAVQLDNEADVEYRLSRAGVHCQLGQLAPARSDLEWVAERDPDNPTLLDLEQYAAMLSDDATRVALPHAAGRHAHRAWASVISNDYVKALEPDAEHNEADETALCMAQSVALLGAGRPRAALDTVNRALIKSPTCAVLLYVRGRAYRQLDLPSQALANFRQACALDPQLTIAQQAAQLVEHELRAAITWRVRVAASDTMQSWSCAQVAAWLRQRHIGSGAVKRIEEFGVDGAALVRCDDADLQCIGISAAFQRRQILEAVQAEKNTVPSYYHNLATSR